jgi:hypothetical protein
MATLDRRYYYVPRRLVHGILLALVALALVIGLGAWTTSPRWLPQIALFLDVDVPIADPDVLVLSADGQNSQVDRQVARLVRDGKVGAVMLAGSPFTSDILAPGRRSTRVGSLTGLGVPSGAIVEVYEGERTWEVLEAVRDTALERGWRRVWLYGTSPGTKRGYLMARRTLGEAGIEVGQTTVPVPQFDANSWWTDNRERGRVVFAWILLVLGWVAGRY